MTKLRTIPRDQATEALFWLNFAKRVLAREISAEEALRKLKFSPPCVFASDLETIPTRRAPEDRPAGAPGGTG